MADKHVAVLAVAVAGAAVAGGLGFAALTGAFGGDDGYVAPPAVGSEVTAGVVRSATESTVVIPPSPTWQAATGTPAPPTPTPGPGAPTSDSSPGRTSDASPTRTPRQTTSKPRPGARTTDPNTTDDSEDR